LQKLPAWCRQNNVQMHDMKDDLMKTRTAPLEKSSASINLPPARLVRWRPAVLAALCLGAVALGAQAQSVVIFGTLTNVDAFNNDPRDAHGIEIQLEGVQPADVSSYFTFNKYNAPQVTPYDTGMYVRYMSVYDPATGTWPASTVPNLPSSVPNCFPGGLFYLVSGCDHFGVSFTNYLLQPRVTTYRWLYEDPANPGNLVPSSQSVSVSAPVWSVTAATATSPAVVAATVDGPVAFLSANPQYTDATWIKVLKTELTREVTLDELRTGNTAVSPEAPAQVETNWKLMQGAPFGSSQHINQGSPNGNSRAIVRRYESYAYTGAYDAVTHQALCLDGLCNAPLAGEVGALLSSQLAAANVMVPSVTVALGGAGSGTVTGAGTASRINCGGNCTTATALGAATLTAKPSSGSVFAGWGGDCAGTQVSCNLDISAALNVTASFDLAPVAVVAPVAAPVVAPVAAPVAAPVTGGGAGSGKKVKPVL
jgi:hypothetical protein